MLFGSVRKAHWHFIFGLSVLVSIAGPNTHSALSQEEPFTDIARRIPPEGIEVDRTRLIELTAKYEDVKASAQSLDDVPLKADVDFLIKAVEYALELNEFYAENNVDKAVALLELAQQRIEQLQSGQTPWTTQTGRVVRGYYSKIDGSAQPYGLEIPTDLDRTKPVPVYVWLHGRGDKITDMHFIHQRMNRAGTIRVDNAIVVHPFGRHCIGFKSAGEIDVLEVVEQVQQHYRVDANRIVLMGFSMGGAGVWHIGAHYADRWVAMSPGAGFAETAEYNRLQPDDYPPVYEQKLWGVYDVPRYARNLLNLPVIAYSGENDKQIQAARVMEEALAGHGHTLAHVIGPGMGHRYHPDSLKEILADLAGAVEVGLNRQPDEVHLQTQTLRYARVHWLEALGLEQHWEDSSIDATFVDEQLTVATKGVRRFRIHETRPIETLVVDGEEVAVASSKLPMTLAKNADGQWMQEQDPAKGLFKRHGLQGPIDDAWLDSFLVVKPSRESSSPRLQAWVEFELRHLEQRWQALFRGSLPTKLDTEVTAEDIATRHLVLFGDPESNLLLQSVVSDLPLVWNDEQVGVGSKSFDAVNHVPALIYPNPLNPERYVVLNSGPTFREAHDRTNSLQNPKLPDWAIIDISVAPSDTSSGRVVVADFFDEQWKAK